MTALAAAAEHTTIDVRPCLFEQAARLASSATYSGFRVSDPCGLIISISPWLFSPPRARRLLVVYVSVRRHPLVDHGQVR